MSLLELSKRDKKEISFIEVAKVIFEERREPIQFKDLVDEIANFLEVSKDQVGPRMVQFYTDLNVDGRFISLGENRWGIREWYPIDQTEEEIVISVKPKKKKKKKVIEEIDEFDEFDDLDDDDLDEDDDEDDDLEDNDEESLEALIEEEEDEFSEDDIVDEVDYDIVDEDEDLDLDEDLDEDLDDEEDEFEDDEEK